MSFDAHECPNGHVTYPAHPLCPECGEEQVDTIDLGELTATVVTWTTSTATPPGVRAPNHLAIVEFDLGGIPRTSGNRPEAGGSETVRAIGQLTSDEVEIGDEVEPVHVDELRDPEAGIREPESQEWDGYRFEPV